MDNLSHDNELTHNTAAQVGAPDRPCTVAERGGRACVEAAVTAHGGWSNWRSVRALRIHVSARFPLLMVKGIAPTLRQFRAEVSTRRIEVRFEDYPVAGQAGHYDGQRVWITAAAETLMERRIQPAAGLRVPFSYWWDTLDFLFFLGYAIWNYKNTPFMLLGAGFQLTALPPVQTRAQGVWQRVQADFPVTVPTHCARQTFYFDTQGLLRRIDYRADVLGRWARGAHFCSGHRDFGGLIYPTYREVLAAWSPNYPLPFPKGVMAWIETVQLVRE